MKIVHLIFTHRFAGSERYAVELANVQAALGHEVTLIIDPRAWQDRVNALKPHISHPVRVETLGGLGWVRAWRLKKRLLQLQPEVVHAHLSTACRLLSRMELPGCLRLATLHIRYKKPQHEGLDALIAIAPWQLDSIPPQLQRHTQQLDNWTQTLPPPSLTQAGQRMQLNLPPSAFIVGTLGRLDPSKGQDTLIKAFIQAQLPPDAYLCIVGAGKMAKPLQAQASDRVVMAGFRPNPADWLRSFNLFVSAARDEPFGLVYLEAMQAGLPILSTASQGGLYLAELFPYPLLPIDDVNAMAEALRLAYSQFHKGHLPAPKYPLERFNPAARVADVLSFYRHEQATLQQKGIIGVKHCPD